IEAFAEVADISALTMIAGAAGNREYLPELAQRVEALVEAHPLYPNLEPFGAEPWQKYSHSTPIFCGITQNPSPPTMSLLWARVVTAWRPHTTWPHVTTSPMSP